MTFSSQKVTTWLGNGVALSVSTLTVDELVRVMDEPLSRAYEVLREKAYVPCIESVVMPVVLRGGRRTNMRLVELVPVSLRQAGYYLEWRSCRRHASVPRLFRCRAKVFGDDGVYECDWYHLDISDMHTLIAIVRAA